MRRGCAPWSSSTISSRSLTSTPSGRSYRRLPSTMKRCRPSALSMRRYSDDVGMSGCLRRGCQFIDPEPHELPLSPREVPRPRVRPAHQCRHSRVEICIRIERLAYPGREELGILPKPHFEGLDGVVTSVLPLASLGELESARLAFSHRHVVACEVLPEHLVDVFLVPGRSAALVVQCGVVLIVTSRVLIVLVHKVGGLERALENVADNVTQLIERPFPWFASGFAIHAIGQTVGQRNRGAASRSEIRLSHYGARYRFEGSLPRPDGAGDDAVAHIVHHTQGMRFCAVGVRTHQ